jgi:hypothetical protein
MYTKMVKFEQHSKAMKISIKIFFVLILQWVFTGSFAQTKLALEQIQIYSSLHPTANYWHLPSDISPILNALDTGIFAKLNLQRDRTYPIQLKELSKQNQLGKITIDWTKSHTIPTHAYLELYEMDPMIAYQNKLIDIPDEKKDSIHSVWFLSCTILNQKQERVFQKTLLVGIMPVQALGMGYPITTSATTPVNLFQAITKGIGFLHPSMSNMDYIEAKVPAAYATDNYWMPILHNQPRTLFDTSKQFISYVNAHGLQLLRLPNAVLNKLDLKNKADNYPFKQVVATIKKNRSNFNAKEYYQVAQQLRDVHDNKDFTLNAYLEFNPEEALLFLPEITPLIFEGKDSVGFFKIKERVVEKNKAYFPDIIYNGYDSTKQFNLGTSYGPSPIIHATVIEGAAYGHTFKIQISLPQKQRTIIVDDQIIMVVEGKNKPHQMFMAPTENRQPAIQDSFKNLLLLMAYSEIFQSPN